MQASSTLSGRTLQTSVTLASLGLFLASCSSGSDGPNSEDIPGSSTMTIQSCVLGCNGPATGPLSCAINEVFVNQDIWVEFTNPVDLTSVTNSTFQIVENSTGIAPSGSFLIDPNNSRRVIFRPNLTFDASGNPNFGLNAASVYRITIPGVLGGGQGPFIENLNNSPNQVVLDCFVGSGLGIFDAVPGAPTVETFIDVRDETGAVVEVLPMAGAESVPINSSLRFEFNDLMNPAALVNPSTNTSNTLRVLLDLDGDPTGFEDQVELPGTYELILDENINRTIVQYFPSGNLPTSGLNQLQPRQIVVDVPIQIVDLGGNAIQNPGNRIFTTEFVPQSEVVLTENFDGTDLTDTDRTSTFIEPLAESVEPVYEGFTPVDEIGYFGRILPGAGGGLGRLGDLRIETGDALVMSTGPDIPTVFGPALTTGPVDEDGVPTTDPEAIEAYHVRTIVLDDYLNEEIDPGITNIEISNGVFDFASLNIQPGAELSFVGENVPRLFVRGRAVLSGSVASTGGDAPAHDGLLGFGGLGGEGGVNAGAGGEGGDRPDLTGSDLTGAITFLGYMHDPDAEVDTNGQQGIGRGGLDPVGFNGFGAGGGGSAWPAVFPGPEREDLGTFEPNSECTSRQAGAPGAGGSFALAGDSGVYIPIGPATGNPIPPPPAAIAADELFSASSPGFSLDPNQGGTLLGGSGGGGGGAGITGTRTNGFPLPPQNCSAPFLGDDLFLTFYIDQSGAGGGGGGGAMQLQAGAAAEIQGRVDVSGGAGGGPVPTLLDGGITSDNQRRTSPGGGGSGGSILIQSLDVDIASVPGTVDISGGVGGFNGLGDGEMRGGAGGPGVIQVFKSPQQVLDAEAVAPGVQAFPSEEPDDVEVTDYVNVQDWSFVSTGPGSATGYQTCWIAPDVPFFNVEYFEDDTSDPDPANHIFGWNMKVELQGPAGVVNYRGPSFVTLTSGMDLEAQLGNQVGSSALIVRFQGVRANQMLDDPCGQELDDDDAVIDRATLTPWVNSPAELNTYWNTIFPDSPGTAAAFRPNLIRAQILFDHDAALFNTIESVVQLTIRSQPD